MRPSFLVHGRTPQFQALSATSRILQGFKPFLQTLLKRYPNAIRDLVDAVGASLAAFPA